MKVSVKKTIIVLLICHDFVQQSGRDDEGMHQREHTD